ncbi:MAG: hypothetical protein K8T26_03220 [Lentisphaerae bacterium]|nr:hypothetical protein [Lentisphaerota bacterium]
MLALEWAGGLALLVAVAWCAWSWHRTGAGGLWSALLHGAIPLYAYLIPMAFLLGAKGHCEDWDAARLCVSVAWSKGIPIYAGLNEGAIQTTMYPPGWVLAYLPVALAHTPTGVLWLGNVMCLFYFVLPLLCLRRLLGGARAPAFLATGLFIFIATQVESLRWACFSPHADAPALGFGLLAVMSTQAGWRPGTPRRWPLALGILCAGLAVWSKQTMLPILPGLILWPLLQRQPRRALQMTIALAVIGVVLAGLSACMFPVDALWLNLLVIPGHHPWLGTIPFNLLKVFLELAPAALIALVVIVGNTVVSAAVLPRRQFLDWVWTSTWAPALMMALLLIPFSLMGLVKMGGAMNSLSPTHYFLYAAAVIQWVEMIKAFADHAAPAPARHGLLAGLAVVVWLVGGLWGLQTLQNLRYGIPDLREGLCQRAYDYLRSGQTPSAFFPTYPLAHVLAEGHLYHYADAMADRDDGGRVPISPELCARYTPADRDVACWDARQFGAGFRRGTRYFPAFTEPVAVAGLPGFRCFARAQPPRPPRNPSE